MKTALMLLGLLLAAVAAADNVTLPEAERVVLESGAVLILNEKRDVPLIGMQIAVRGGAVADPNGKHGVTKLLAELLEKGAGDRDYAEFATTVASVGGEISVRADLEALTISAEFMAKDAKLMVELVADLLQRPLLSADEFAKLRTRSISLIKARKGADPSRLMPSYANAYLFGDHPYGNPVGGSESSLENISHDDVLAYYTDQVGADRLVVAVSGDIAIAEMRQLLVEAFANWRPAAGTLPTLSVPDSVSGRRVYLIDKPGATQSYFYIGNTGVSRGYSGRASLDLANTVFGGRFTSMLMTELRTRSGLSYSARSSLSRYSISGSTFITSFTETDKTVDAINVALDTLNRFRDAGLNDDMIVSARNYVMGQFPTHFETARQLAGIFAELESQDLDASHVSDYGNALADVTPESVAMVIEDVYPTPENLVFVILGDADSIRDPIARFGPVTEISISEPRFHP